MHPSISIFPNTSFYDGKISDAPSVMQNEHQKKYLPDSIFGPYSFVNIGDGAEEFDELGYSRRNLVEVVVIQEILCSLQRGTFSLFTNYLVVSITFQFFKSFSSMYNVFYFNACWRSLLQISVIVPLMFLRYQHACF
jgi:hypothetical protein